MNAESCLFCLVSAPFVYVALKFLGFGAVFALCLSRV